MIFPNDITVGLVSYNAKHDLKKALHSLLNAGCQLKQIMVIDVASTDDTLPWLKQNYPELKTIPLSQNNGPNPARNKIITESSTPYVLIMDPDVKINDRTVPILREIMNRDERIAIASPLVLYENQNDVIQYGGTWLHFICEAANRWQNKTLAERGHKIEDIGCASGNAILLTRKAACHVNLFDEAFFMGKEDGDFTHRITLAGYRIVESPDAHVFHQVKGRNTRFFYYQIRNRWYFMLKNYQRRTLFLLLPALLVHEGLQFSMLAIKGHALTYLKAMIGLIKMLPLILRERPRIAKYRARQDWEIMVSDPIVMRQDMLNNPFLKCIKTSYDRFLRAYWGLLKKTVFISPTRIKTP